MSETKTVTEWIRRRWTLRGRMQGPLGVESRTIDVIDGPLLPTKGPGALVEVLPVEQFEEVLEQRGRFRSLAVTECNRWHEATKELTALRAAIDEMLDEQIAALVYESAKEIEAEEEDTCAASGS